MWRGRTIDAGAVAMYKGVSASISVPYSQVSWSVENTGPSVQTQIFPFTVFSTQQRQAPTPHAIRFSSDTKHGVLY